MSNFKTIAAFKSLTGKDAPTQAELSLIAACQAGEPYLCAADQSRPTVPSDERKIRAALLRLLILGGSPDCGLHQKGIYLIGAYIPDALDLDFCTAVGATRLINCHFSEAITARQAHLIDLNLSGSALPGLIAEGIQVSGNIFLRFSVTSAYFHATGPVLLAGSRIGGQLDCTSGRFENPGGEALNAQGANIGGDVLLRHKTHSPNFHSTGEVSFSGAVIGGQFDCSSAIFENNKVKETDKQRCAFFAQKMQVKGVLTWNIWNIDTGDGCFDFTSAHVGGLRDNLKSWPKDKDRLVLDGFTYDTLSWTFTDAKQRLEWLSRGTILRNEFHPQPYTQLAKVLHSMGHDRDARIVRVEQAKLIRHHARARLKIIPNGNVNVDFRSLWADLLNVPPLIWDLLQRWVVGYGYLPFRSLISLSLLFATAAILAQLTWQEGSFAPNSDVILVSHGWQAALASDCLPDITPSCDPNPAATWSNDPTRGLDWDSFNPFGYAADLVVPALNLGQADAWAPSKDRGAWGSRLWWGRWVLTALGLVVTALGAAAVTGIIKRDQD